MSVTEEVTNSRESMLKAIKATARPVLEAISSRWVQIVIYSIACLTTSCLYFGWQQYSAMLIRNEAYAWLCPPTSSECEDQSASIERLYYYANGSEYISAALGGIALDHLGPRITALLGELLFAVAILLVAFSSRRFQAYIPGLILSGVCVNVISFPSLTVIENWPTRQALAVSIIVGAQSGASVIAPIMERIWNLNPGYSYAGLWGVYLVAIWLPISILYILALPKNRNFAVLVQREESEEAQTAASEESVKVPSPRDIAVDKDVDALMVPEGHWKAFWRDVRTLDLIVMALYFTLQMMQFAYYPAVVRESVSEKISNYVGWMTPLQAIFSVVIGFVMDYTGTYVVMFGMCTTLIFVALSVAFGPHLVALQYIVGFVFVFMQSATYNLKYTFVNEMYDPYNFGKLVGLLGIMGGIGVYINLGVSMSRQVKTIFLIYVGVAAFMVGCTTFLYVRQRQGVNYKTLAGIEQVKRIKAMKGPSSEPPETESV